MNAMNLKEQHCTGGCLPSGMRSDPIGTPGAMAEAGRLWRRDNDVCAVNSSAAGKSPSRSRLPQSLWCNLRFLRKPLSLCEVPRQLKV